MSLIYGVYTGSHSSSVTLMKDGKIVNCFEEERYTRIKAGDNYDTNLKLSTDAIQKYTGVSFEQTDYNVFARPTPMRFASELTKRRFETVSHHKAHAYGAYFTSGMKGKVMTISYDGGGEYTVMKIYLCEDGRMDLVKSEPHSAYGSLSHLWGFSTSSMMGYNKNFEGNWKMCKDEGKLMGMAPDGHYDERIYNLLKSIINYKDLRFYPSNTASRTQYVGDMLYYGGYFDNPENREIYSFNLQKLTNDLFLEFLKDLHTVYPEYTKLCLTGGLFANVKLNQKINELDWVDEIYIIPPMGDEGLSLGACIYKANQLGEITHPFHLNDVHFGQKYSDDEIFEISKNYNFKRKSYQVEEIAKEINEGGIIGWFQGGSEFGPRALGARSILVRPTDIATHKILNSRLKRHDTMPFAPIVLSEFFDEIFTSNKSKYTSEFMTLCYDTKDEWIDKIPAVIQKSDKTARPQIVVKDKLPKFWEILNKYYEISGIPVLLNTSFNSHNEPIIENPKQAFDSLEKNIIDKLVIGEYVYFIE